jgi:DNA-binding protein YbaB
MKNIFGQVGDLYKMQKEAKKMQNDMKKVVVSGLSRNEDVEILMNGAQEVIEIGIDDSYMSIDQKAKLEKALIEAFKDGQKKIQKKMMQDMDMDKIKSMLGGN